jgi:protein pelota
VRFACDRGAVDTLLLSDSLFRAREPAARRRFAQMVEDTRAAGGTVHVFSQMHVSGEQLAQVRRGAPGRAGRHLSVAGARVRGRR